MKKIAFFSLLLVVFSCGKTVSLPFNTPVFTHIEPGDVLNIENYPSQWGYSRIILGIQASGVSTLEGALGRETCQYPITGYYQPHNRLLSAIVFQIRRKPNNPQLPWKQGDGPDLAMVVRLFNGGKFLRGTLCQCNAVDKL